MLGVRWKYIGAVMGCAHFADHQYLLWNGQAYQ